jgi:glycosyltransferase involved in cell wall biosynthesis
MHIVQLSTRRDTYGGEVCLANLAGGLAARGHRVTCVVQPEADLRRRLGGEPVEIVPLPMVDWFDPGTCRRLRAWLRAVRPDVLATHLPRDWFIAAVAARGLPTALVATRHLLHPVSWPVCKRPFLRRYGALIAVSEAVGRVVAADRLVAPNRQFVVPNGVRAPGPAPAGSDLRRRLGLPPDALLVGLVGRLAPDKGVDVLLAAAARLLPGRPAVHVVLVGDLPADRYGDGLRSRVAAPDLAGRVHLCGYVAGMGDRMAELDVLVVASEAEPFGLVTIEAMAAGVPVVATASGGSPEIVRDGREGYLVPYGDAGALIDRLARLTASPDLRRGLGAAGRRRHHARFTAARMVAATETVYETCCRTAGSRDRTANATGPGLRRAPQLSSARSGRSVRS